MKFFIIIFLIFSIVGLSADVAYSQVEAVAVEEVNDAGAEESVVYGIISNTIHVMHKFVTEGLFGKVAEETRGLFKIIVSIYLFFTLVVWLKTKQIDILRFMWTMAGLIFAFNVIYGEGNFERFIYKPVIATTMQTSNFVITASSGDTIPKYSNKDPLFNMLKYMEENIHNIMKIGDRLAAKSESFSAFSFFEGIKYAIKGFFIMLIYFALMFIFSIMYMLGIIALHFLLVFTPFAILIGSVPLTRGILKNWGKSIFTFMLIPIFASIAMGATIFILKEVNVAVDLYLLKPEGTPVPAGLYTQIILVGLFSAYFHLKAPEFASMLVGGPITNFGAVFTATTATGIAATKVAALPVIQKAGRFAGRNLQRMRRG